MEDAATAEISRSQIWQWLRHGVSILGPGDMPVKLTRDGFNIILQEELAKIRDALGREAFEAGHYPVAASIFAETASSDELADFLTLPAYEALRTLA